MYRCASGSHKNSGLVGMGTDLQDFQAGDADELVFFPGSKNSGTNEDYKCGGDWRGEGVNGSRIKFFLRISVCSEIKTLDNLYVRR
jgi:hypothetical protein